MAGWGSHAWPLWGRGHGLCNSGSEVYRIRRGNAPARRRRPRRAAAGRATSPAGGIFRPGQVDRRRTPGFTQGDRILPRGPGVQGPVGAVGRLVHRGQRRVRLPDRPQRRRQEQHPAPDHHGRLPHPGPGHRSGHAGRKMSRSRDCPAATGDRFRVPGLPPAGRPVHRVSFYQRADAYGAFGYKDRHFSTLKTPKNAQ